MGDRQHLEMVDGASLNDLYEIIQKLWGMTLPAELWSQEKRRFREQVVVMSHQEDLEDPNALLYDEQEIWLIEAVAGGIR